MYAFLADSAALKLNRSHDICMFAMCVVEDIELFTNGDADFVSSHFVRKDGSKFIVEIGCINAEYECASVEHILHVLHKMADAARADTRFQEIIDNAIAAGGDDKPCYDNPGEFFEYMEKWEVVRSNHVQFISHVIAEDLDLLDGSDNDVIQGGLFKLEGSAYVVNFFSSDMEYSLPTKAELRDFLSRAADAARDCPVFKDALDEAWERHCNRNKPKSDGATHLRVVE